MRIFVVISCLVALVVCVSDENTLSSSRVKRSYYGGYDSYGYGDGDFWYAGRIFGIIIGALMFLLCCCLPCICLAGIWFLGWFGFRQNRRRNDNKAVVSTISAPPPSSTVYSSPPRSRQIHVESVPRQPPNELRGDQIIYQAEDRYYSSSAPATDTRPDTYRVY